MCLQRASCIAEIYHGLIAEELVVKEVICTKGTQMKRMRMMGRGRTGFGYKRYTHCTVKLEQIDFDKEIASAKTFKHRTEWTKRRDLVNKIKEGAITGTVIRPVNPRFKQPEQPSEEEEAAAAAAAAAAGAAK